MKKIRSSRDGYITLLGLLIIGGAALGLTVSLLSAGLLSTKNAANFQEAVQARFLADACLEEALQRIRTTTGFLGSGTLSVGGGTCLYQVVPGTGGGERRTITVLASRGLMTRRGRVEVRAINPRIIVTAWTEGASF